MCRSGDPHYSRSTTPGNKHCFLAAPVWRPALDFGLWRRNFAHVSQIGCAGEAGAAQLPLVAIVGRPNVGKSTLFNRLTGSRRSIVGDEPGITRDRIYGEYEWAGRRYRLVDTGGIVPDDPELIATEIFVQAKVALEEADALVMVVDVRTELARPDYDLARLLQRGGKPLFLAVNKVEAEALAEEAENFRQAGDQRCVSGEFGARAGRRRVAGCDCGGGAAAPRAKALEGTRREQGSE